jgi:HTH-type transcriptional regulator, sugar sensing transcriptional regulator
MLTKDLQKLGLNEKEARVYLAALELGEANIQQISKKSLVKRTTLYDIIESLKLQGLVSQYIKNKKTLYCAVDPHKLEDEAEERQHTVRRILPQLLTIANALDTKPKVRFFEGYEGIKEVYKDTLHYPDAELLAWVSQEAIEAFDVDFLNNHYLPKRVVKKIWVRAIAPDAKEMQGYAEVDEKSLRKTRLADAQLFPLRVEINLYGKNKIAAMSFDEKFGMIIESQKIFETLQSIFEMNWRALESRNKSKDTNVTEEE